MLTGPTQDVRLCRHQPSDTTLMKSGQSRGGAVDTLTIVVWVLIAVRLILLLPPPRRRPARPRPAGDAAPRARVDACLGEVLALPPEPAPCVEAALYQRLSAGAISRERYRAEMAALAVRDQQEHPVEPPYA
jgi:hypothetical protein